MRLSHQLSSLSVLPGPNFKQKSHPIQNQIVKIVKVKKLNCSFYNIKKSCKKMFLSFFLE